MDNYEKAALDFKVLYPMMGELEGFLSAAFRWYDSEREKETCEGFTKINEDGIAMFTDCGVLKDINAPFAFCPWCGHRIVEKGI